MKTDLREEYTLAKPANQLKSKIAAESILREQTEDYVHSVCIAIYGLKLITMILMGISTAYLQLHRVDCPLILRSLSSSGNIPFNEPSANRGTMKIMVSK